MIRQYEFNLQARRRGYHLVTSEILSQIELPKTGIIHVFIKHTSAGLCLNENADPDVRIDFETMMNRIVPEHQPGLVHTIEGPDDMPAHIKSALIGSSVSFPVSNGRPNLGIWQGIYLCEFRNHGGPRKIVVTVYGE